VKFDKRYWIFIAAATVSAATASSCTLYLSTVSAHFRECDSVAAACFVRIGMAPAMVLGILALMALMVAIPYIFRQNERPGLLSVVVLGCIVGYTAFDALNDVSAVMGYHNAYLIAHTLLSTTNTVAGNIVGTGASVC
jgi:hypothetical protein